MYFVKICICSNLKFWQRSRWRGLLHAFCKDMYLFKFENLAALPLEGLYILYILIWFCVFGIMFSSMCVCSSPLCLALLLSSLAPALGGQQGCWSGELLLLVVASYTHYMCVGLWTPSLFVRDYGRGLATRRGRESHPPKLYISSRTCTYSHVYQIRIPVGST